MTALDDLVDDMAALLRAPCTLEDPDFRLIGFSDQRGAEPPDEVRQRSILERGSTAEVRDWFLAHGIQDSEGPVRTPADPTRGIAARVCVPARHLGRVHGYFWLLEGSEPMGEESWPEAVRLAAAAGALLHVVEHRQTRRNALYREAVEGPSGAARRAARDLASAAGLDVRDPVTCVLVRRPDLVEQLASRPSRPGLVWASEDGDVAAAVVRADLVSPSDSLPEVLASLGLGRRLPALDQATYVGVGPTVRDTGDLDRARSGARTALRVLRRNGRAGVQRWADLGPLSLLGVARDDDLATCVLTPAITALLASAPPVLVQTARVYLDEAGSVARTADRLTVHRQTVYHRLAQVERHSRCDLSTGEGRLRLHLALRLAPYLQDD